MGWTELILYVGAACKPFTLAHQSSSEFKSEHKFRTLAIDDHSLHAADLIWGLGSPEAIRLCKCECGHLSGGSAQNPMIVRSRAWEWRIRPFGVSHNQSLSLWPRAHGFQCSRRGQCFHEIHNDSCMHHLDRSNALPVTKPGEQANRSLVCHWIRIGQLVLSTHYLHSSDKFDCQHRFHNATSLTALPIAVDVHCRLSVGPCLVLRGAQHRRWRLEL